MVEGGELAEAVFFPGAVDAEEADLVEAQKAVGGAVVPADF